MGNRLSFSTTKNKQVKFYLILQKSVLKCHVIFEVILAVVKLLANSFAKVDINLRSNLYSEIVLSGGNTMFDGFP